MTFRSAVASAWEWIRSFSVVIVAFLAVRTVGVEPFRIPTSSMEGTLLVGDFLLVNKAVFGAEIPGTGFRLPALDEPAPGDVVVFRPPHDPGRHYVKRIVGGPGDTLEMRDKVLFRNGVEQSEPWAVHGAGEGDAAHPGMSWQVDHLERARPEVRRRYRPTRDNWGPLLVPPDRFFVLGDNRDNSEDSRYWGFVERNRIEGRPWRVYYSLEDGPGGLPTPSRIRWSRIGGRVE